MSIEFNTSINRFQLGIVFFLCEEVYSSDELGIRNILIKLGIIENKVRDYEYLNKVRAHGVL